MHGWRHEEDRKWKDLNSVFFFPPLVCPVFSIYRSCVISPISPGLILIKVIVIVAVVTSYVIGRLTLELGFRQLLGHSSLKHHMTEAWAEERPQGTEMGCPTWV